MKRGRPKAIVEERCLACKGTGVQEVVKQPASGRRIYPPRCTRCEGKGRITKSQTDSANKPVRKVGRAEVNYYPSRK
jgi:DnaJ-class molecular chaperone